MKRLTLGGAFALLLASGCVSESKSEDLRSRERDLAWRLDAAEKSSKTRRTPSGGPSSRRSRSSRRTTRSPARSSRSRTRRSAPRRRASMKKLKARLAELQGQGARQARGCSRRGGSVGSCSRAGSLFASGRHELTKRRREGGSSRSSSRSRRPGPRRVHDRALGRTRTRTRSARRPRSTWTTTTSPRKRANSVRRFLTARGRFPLAGSTSGAAGGETRSLASRDNQGRQGAEPPRRDPPSTTRRKESVGDSGRGAARDGDTTKPASTLLQRPAAGAARSRARGRRAGSRGPSRLRTPGSRATRRARGARPRRATSRQPVPAMITGRSASASIVAASSVRIGGGAAGERRRLRASRRRPPEKTTSSG